MVALPNLWKMFFISSKKLFLFSRYSNFCISVFPSVFPVSHCFRGWSKISLKVCEVINCINKNLITNFACYLEKEKSYDIETLPIRTVLNEEHFFFVKSYKNVHKRLVPDSFLILVINPKQPLQAKYFKNKIFWKRLIKKP